MVIELEQLEQHIWICDDLVYIQTILHVDTRGYHPLLPLEQRCHQNPWWAVVDLFMYRAPIPWGAENHVMKRNEMNRNKLK